LAIFYGYKCDFADVGTTCSTVNEFRVFVYDVYDMISAFILKGLRTMSMTCLNGPELKESMKSEKHHQHQHEMPLPMTIIPCRTLKWMGSSRLMDFE
jgi:hypothetical protein